MIELIGAPFDAYGHSEGSRLSPTVLRMAGLADTLRHLGEEVADFGDVPIPTVDDQASAEEVFQIAKGFFQRLRDGVHQAITSDRTALVIGGDHSIAIGSICGALKALGDDLAVLWIDAHADCNTPETSPSGNMHGMVLAALLGAGSGGHQWAEVRSDVVPGTFLRPDRLGWVGLRDVDPGEAKLISELPGCFPTTMHEVDSYGIQRVIEGFDRWMRGCGARNLWVSFDVDVLDPVLAPGTGTAVRGGLTYREGHLCAELLHTALSKPDCPYKLVGLDLVETNPLLDHANQTTRIAIEWIGSLFGKSILGKSVQMVKL